MKRILFPSLFIILFSVNSDAQFIKEYYKSSTQNTGFQALVPVSNALNSNLYIAGYYGDQILIGEIKQNGSFVWSKKIMVEDPGYMVNCMFKDSDGNLILCGGLYTGIDDNGHAFAIKFNPISKSILWFQKSTVNTHFFDGAEIGAGGDYVFGGQEEGLGTGNQADHLVVKANRTTGEMTMINNLNANINENVDALLVAGDSLNIYTTGRYELNPGGASKFRICLSKMDQNGNLNWTRSYINNNATTGKFYSKDIIQDGSSFLIAGCGDETGTNSVKNLFLLKTDLNGEVIWVNKYDITSTSNDGLFCSIRKHDSGYIIYGSLYDGTYTDVFLFNIDFEGNINWSKSYPYRKKTGVFGMHASSSLVIIGNKIFHVGEKLYDDGSIKAVLHRTSISNGETGLCDTDIPVSRTTLIEPYDGFYSLSNVTSEPLFNSNEFLVKSQTLNSSTSCENVLGMTTNYGQEINHNKNGELYDDFGEIGLYPNPNNGNFYLDLSNVQDITSPLVKIYKSTGVLIFEKQFDQALNSNLDISTYPAGIYFIIISDIASNKYYSKSIVLK